MPSFLESIFGSNLSLWRESASTSIVGAGVSATTAVLNDAADSGAVAMDAQLSAAGNKYTAKRGSVPSASSLDTLVNVIKQIRNQYQVRQMLEDCASFMVENARIKPGPGKWKEAQTFIWGTEVQSKLWRVALELSTIGWCVVYVSEMDKQGIPGITVLHNCTVTRGVDGKARVFLKLTDTVKDHIRENPKFYPRYWQQFLDSQDGIDITRVYDKGGRWKQGGAYFVSLEPEGEDVYPIAPLYPVLGEAVDAQRINEVMGQLMDLVKWYYFQIRLGNPKGQDERDGRIKAISRDRVQEVGRAFGLGIKSGAIVTPGDVNAEHHIPETSPFALPRTEREALKDAFQDQLGLPDFEGATSDAAARMMARSYLPRVTTVREILRTKFVEPFLADMAQRFPQMEGAYSIFPDGSLEELGTRIQKHRQLFGTGAYSLQTVNEMLDPDFNIDREVEKKTYEQKFKDAIGNLYEPGQGLGGDTETQGEDKPKGTVGDPKSGDNKKATDPGSQPGRPTK